MLLAAGTLAAQTAPPPVPTPVPKPFPTSTPPAGSAAKPAAASAGPAASGAAQDGAAIDPLLAKLPIYPGAEFLESFDAGEPGRAQRVFMFGSNDPYESIVVFYRTQLRKNGEAVLKEPRIQQFDLGSFDARSMAQRPSVIVKDYSSPDPAGYIHVAGTTQKRFRTLVQIIPVAR